jgi:peroxiredoxin Q/BCP
VSLRGAAFCAAVLAAVPGCRAPREDAGAAGASSAAAAVARPLDTSWEQSPSTLLAAGAIAPDFEGIAHTGMRVRLSSLATAPVVVVFYPDDRDAGAVAALREFRDSWLELVNAVGMVIGVSPDDRTEHKDFATAEHLPFLLVADSGGKIARAFGVPSENGRPKRVTFVVGKDLRILRAFPEAASTGHAREVLLSLREPHEPASPPKPAP